MSICRFLAIVVLAFSAQAAIAETVRLRCEFWHPNLGQQDDRTRAIDLAARTCNGEPCNGEPCKISDSELAWKAEGGRADLKVDRIAGEGSLTYMSESLGQFKNCKPLA